MGNYEKIELLCLKGKIKGLAAEGQRTRKFIRRTERERRSRHWDVKRSIGERTRHHLLAYGYMRGIPYTRLEQPAIDNKPNVRKIMEIVHQHILWFKRKDVTIDVIYAWMEGLNAHDVHS